MILADWIQQPDTEKTRFCVPCKAKNIICCAGWSERSAFG